MEFFALIAGIAFVLLMLFGIGATPPAPAPRPAPPVIDMLTTERGLLLMKVDLELQAVELRLRQSGAVQAAEGAALVRARTIEFLKGYK